MKLTELFESTSVEAKVKALSIEQVIDRAGFCATGDDLTKLERSKNRSIEEVTDDQDGNIVVVIKFFYNRVAYDASITFDKNDAELEVISATVEKDTNWGRR